MVKNAGRERLKRISGHFLGYILKSEGFAMRRKPVFSNASTKNPSREKFPESLFFRLKREPSISSNVIHQMLVNLYDRKDKVTQFATSIYGHVEIPGSELPM